MEAGYNTQKITSDSPAFGDNLVAVADLDPVDELCGEHPVTGQVGPESYFYGKCIKVKQKTTPISAPD